MKVYRYATEEELNHVLNGEIQDIGRSFVRNRSNSHRYAKNKRYLHFFKDKNSINQIKVLKRKDTRFYICEYDIPMLVLMIGRGVGYYHPVGYKEEVSSHVEYIVSNDIFKPQWLTKYEIDKETIKVC